MTDYLTRLLNWLKALFESRNPTSGTEPPVPDPVPIPPDPSPPVPEPEPDNPPEDPMAKRGDHVNAVVESGKDPEIAHYLEHDGDKDKLQRADGSVVRYARRDPSDYDEKGGGQTWYPL